MQMKFKYLNNFFKGKRMIADKLIERFTNFFTRSVAPSSIFFVLLYFNDMFFNDGYFFGEFFCFLCKAKSIHDVFLYLSLVLLILAYGYINQIFSQLLDNLIKENYDDWDEGYNKLRKAVIEKFTAKYDSWKSNPIIPLNDYNLYQILAKDKSIVPSNSYVDEAKSIHTFTVAIIFHISLYLFYYRDLDFMYTYALLLPIIIYLSRWIAKNRYKARNKRLYINYLLKEDKKDKCEKEIKIKSIKVEVDE